MTYYERENLNEPLPLIESDELLATLTAIAKLNEYYSDPVFGFQRFLNDQVVTVDETRREHRRWPDKPYLRDLAWLLVNEKRIAIPKSRRMMVTWILVAYCCWCLRFQPGHFIAWQSETFTKAAYALGPNRMAFIEDHLVDDVLRRDYYPLEAKGGYERIRYRFAPRQNVFHAGRGGGYSASTIVATAQGASVLNMYTPSVIVLDECEFQPYARETLANTLPLLEDGVQMILCSSSNGPSGVLAEMARSIGFTRFT